jgi:DNA-binding beta-propeller fold protein YncE
VAIVTALTFGAGTGVAHAASPGNRLWARIYDGPVGTDAPAAIAVNPHSSAVYVTGNSTGDLTGSDIATVAYDVDGGLLWQKRYDGPAHLDDSAADIGVSPNGSTVFVTGVAGGPSSSQILVVAYDAADGGRTWSTRVGSNLLFDEAAALAVSPNGSMIFVTGVRRYYDDTDFRTIALDATTGSVRWSRRYEGTFHQTGAATDLAVSSDGSLVAVSGWVETSGPGLSPDDAVVVAYDAATGSRRWAERFDGTAHRDDAAYGVTIAPDGTAVYVAAASESLTHDLDYLTLAYDSATGAQLWHDRYDGPAAREDVPAAIGVSSSGATVFVTGRSMRMSQGTAIDDYATLAIDTAAGDRLWAKRYDAGIGGSDAAVDLAVSPDGSKVFVSGTSEGIIGGHSSATDIVTVGLDTAGGNQLGVRRYDGSCNFVDRATGLALSADGSRVFVTGKTDCLDPNTSGDFATIAYPS